MTVRGIGSAISKPFKQLWASPTWRNIGAFGTASLLSLAIRLLSGAAVVRFATPAQMGAFAALNLTFSYAAPLHLGVQDGLALRYPFLVGAGKHAEALKLAAASQAWALALSVAGLLFCGVLSVRSAVLGDADLCLGWAITGGSLAIYFYSNSYLQVTYRTSNDFKHLAFGGVVQNLVSLATVPLAAVFGFLGLCVRSLFTYIAFFACLWARRPIRLPPKWSTSSLIQLVRIGAPILAGNLVPLWWSAIDRTLILKCLGTSVLGLFALPALLTTVLSTLPDAAAQVLLPKFAHNSGRGSPQHESVRAALYTSFALMGMNALLAAPLLFLIPVTVRLLFPQYAEAVVPTQWAVLIGIPLSFRPVESVCTASGRQATVIGSSISGAFTYGITLVVLMTTRALSAADFVVAMLVGRVAQYGLLSVSTLLALRRATQ